MGRGIDRRGPCHDDYLVSPVVLVDVADEFMWEDLPHEICTMPGWSRPQERRWIDRSKYFVIAEHDGKSGSMIVASADADNLELFVVSPTSSIDALMERHVNRWHTKLVKWLMPWRPSYATSSWTSAEF